ncbi:hypothetical protein GCM10009680_50720 [Streptomyces yatensis]|uniref:Uncharacterized protein n=1 Tax=Streptomyces yatensis TaxID=155177 RepID=A0ABN2IES2_9ACTN
MPPAAKAPEKLAIDVVLIQLDMLERPQTSFHVCDVPVWCQWVGVSDGTSELGVFDGRALRKGVVTVVGRFL